MKKTAKGKRGSGKSKNWSPSFSTQNTEREMRTNKEPRNLNRETPPKKQEAK